MKKFILILITLIVISFSASAQSAGDYRSIASGNWNDATKWEIYNGSNWVATLTYPGQNSGTGAVFIHIFHELKLTATVPYPIASFLIDELNDYPAEEVRQNGIVAFSSENPVSLTVSGDVVIHGELRMDNQSGTKTHTLFVGGRFEVGTFVSDPSSGCLPPHDFIPATFQTINQDDKLSVVFNSSSSINGGPAGIEFQDITFNGTRFYLYNPIYIRGAANFVNGIVKNIYLPTCVGGCNADCGYTYNSYNGSIIFYDGATVSSASNVSFVDGAVTKWGDDPFIFPIGNGNLYAPLTISAPAQGASIGASYVRSNASDLGPINDAELFSVSNCEYWRLSGPDNNHPLEVTVGWNEANGCSSSPYVTNVSEVTLAHFNFVTQKWDSHSGTGIGTTMNGTVTWSGVTTSGAFTLGNLTSVCSAPWGQATNISPNSATLSWTPISGAVSYDVDYKPYTSSEWINAITATSLTSVNLSGLNQSAIYDWKVRANCSSGPSSYRHSQFTTTPPDCNDVYETNNTSSQASAISLGNTISAAISSVTDVDWFKVTMPNNSNTNLEVTLSNLPADYDLYVYNKSLKLVGSSINSGTLNEVVIYNSNARNATYYIKVIGKGGAYNPGCYHLQANVFGNGGRTASHASVPVNEVTEDLNKQLLYPNPASEFVYLNFNSATEGVVNIEIVNSIGQLVKQHPVNTIKGHNQFKIQVADIRPGMYILRINKGDLNLIRKFVIAR